MRGNNIALRGETKPIIKKPRSEYYRDSIVDWFLYGTAKPFFISKKIFIEVECRKLDDMGDSWLVFARLYHVERRDKNDWIAACTNSWEFKHSRVASLRAAVYRLTDDL